MALRKTHDKSRPKKPSAQRHRFRRPARHGDLVRIESRIEEIREKAVIFRFALVLGASVIMIITLRVLLAVYPKPQCAQLGICIAAGIAAFAAASWLFGVREVKDLLVWISKKK